MSIIDETIGVGVQCEGSHCEACIRGQLEWIVRRCAEIAAGWGKARGPGPVGDNIEAKLIANEILRAAGLEEKP